MNDRVYFRQWLSGRDFATDDRVARQMVNFVYAIGDRETGEAVLVDAAYAPAELVEKLTLDEMSIVGTLSTHYHPDHVGGSMMGETIAGLVELLEVADVPVHVQGTEVDWITRATGVQGDSLVAHQSGDVVRVGDVEITLIHTPGHTPGSQCFLVEGCLVSGDTLFLDGCGRTDLPGSDPEEMYRSLTEQLARISGDTILYPGHNYSAERSAPLASVRRDNYALAPVGAEQWLAMFAR